MGRFSSVKLPPQVEGLSKGSLLLKLGPVAWAEPLPRPESVAVGVRWWGDTGPGDLLHPFPLGAAVRFQLHSGPKYIARYLQDMGTLALVLKQPDGASGGGGWTILGTASVGLGPLAVGTPLSGTFTVVGDQGRAIGQLPVSLSLEFSHPAMTSFELNEHLAAEAAAANAATVAAAAVAVAAPLGAAVPGTTAGQGAQGAPAVEEGLRCPDILRQLEQAVDGCSLEESLAQCGLGEADVLGGADIERLLRQLLPGTPEGASAYAAAVLSADQSECAEEGGMDTSTFVEAVRECASLERSLSQDVGTAARQLWGLVGLLSSRHLEVAQAFNEAGGGREEAVTYPQLLAMLRTLSPGVAAQELRIMLMVLAALDKDGAGRVSLPMLKQALPAISFAQAYPNEEEVAQQQQAAAARQEKAAAAAAASAADLASQAAAGSRRRQAVGKLRATREQGRAGRDGSLAAEEPPASHVDHALRHPDPVAALEPGVVAHPLAYSDALSLTAHPQPSGHPVGAGSWLAEQPGQVPAQQGQVVGWPASVAGVALQQPIAVGVPVQQLWQPPLLLQQQPGLAQLPTLGDPLTALISQAEQLQLALSRATFRPSQPVLGGSAIGGGMGVGSQRSSAYGTGLGVPLPLAAASLGLPSLPTNPLLASEALGTLPPPPAAERVGLGPLPAVPTLGASQPPLSAAAPAAAMPAAGLPGAAEPVAGAKCHLSAASAALIEAAKALAGAKQPAPADANTATAATSADTGPAAEGLSPGPAPTMSSGLEVGLPRAALDGSASPDLSLDDPAELAEDIILQELFFSQPAQSRGSAGQAALGASSRERQAGPGAESSAGPPYPAEQSQGGVHGSTQAQPPEPPGPQLVMCLHLGPLRLQQQQQQIRGEASSAGSDTCTTSGRGRVGLPQALGCPAVRVRGVVKQLHPSAQPVEFSMAASSTSREGQGPAVGGLAGSVQFVGQHATQVQLEVAIPQACVKQGRLPSTLFIEVWDQANKLVGVVRAPLLLCHLPAAPSSSLPAVACEGCCDVWNVLEGRAEGSVEVFGVLQEKGQACVVPAMRHGFSVTIQTAYRLPGSVAYAEAQLCCPDSRYIKYSFPGEPEPLFTKDVPIMSNPTFDATAHHSVTLPAEKDIAAVLASQGGRKLRFEVWDQWVDGRRELHSWAEMPMAELAGLVRAAGVEGAGAGAEVAAVPAAAQSHLLPLVTEFDADWTASHASAASAKSPALRVDLAYRAERVLTPAPAPQEPEIHRGAPKSSPHVPAAPSGAVVAGRQWLGAASGRGGAAASLAAVAGPGQRQQWQQQQQEVWAKVWPGQSPAVACQRGAAVTSCDQLRTGVCPADDSDWAEVDANAENDVLLANCSPVRPLKAAPAAAPKGVDAVLCVEIIQACGLSAAVREACAFSSSNTALSRALKVGAHPFARLALFPSDSSLQKRAPPLQTPFQAQTFCPKFQARHEYRLQLDARMLQALAEKELLVEVWHHLPRSQAVAAALSSGRSSLAATALGAAGGGSSEREVLLGSASGPLLGVLRRPQGFRGWLGLKSRRGEAVGAVQLAVYFSELEGQPVFSSMPERSPLSQCEALPDILPPHLGWLLKGTEAEAFRGQQAVVAVEVLEVVPPKEEGAGQDADRPKADLYHATYRLPGAACSHSTAGKTLTAGVGQRPTASAAVLSGRAWSAKLRHMGTFRAAATAALRKALASFALAVSVYKQPVSSGTKPGRAPAPAVLVGTAEVDLSALLWARQPSSRAVSGSFLLIDPSAKSLGGARVRVRVSLDLSPSHSAQQGPGVAVGATDVLEEVWELEGEEEGDTERQARRQEEEEEEEEEEELQSLAAARTRPPAARPAQTEVVGAAAQPAVAGSEWAMTQRPGSGQGPAAAAATGRATCAPGSAAGSERGREAAASNSNASSGDSPRHPVAFASQHRHALSPPLSAAPSAVHTHGSNTQGSSSRPPSGTPQADGSGPSGIAGQSLSGIGAGGRPGQERSGPSIVGDGPPPPAPASRPSGQLLVHIEKAVHLPHGRPGSAGGLRSSGSSDGNGAGGRSWPAADGGYCAQVSLTWGPQKLRHSTGAVEVRGLGGPSGGTATWDELLAVDADASAFQAGSTSSGSFASVPEAPGTSGDGSTGGGGRGKGPTGGPILLLNVWSCPAGSSLPGGSRPANPSPASRAALVGCAAVDLTMLPLLGEVRGYFNVVDYLQQVRGQLRLSVRPDEDLQRALQAARGRGRGWRSGCVERALAGAGGEGPAGEPGQSAAAGVAAGSHSASLAGLQPAAGSMAQGAVPDCQVEASQEGLEGEGEEESGEQAAAALMAEMQARMQALQLLSRRLGSREPVWGAEAAAGSSSGSGSSGPPRVAQAGPGVEVAAMEAAAAPSSVGAAGDAGPSGTSGGGVGAPSEGEQTRVLQPGAASLSIRQIDVSDDEGGGGAWFGLRLPPVLGQGRMAWSGSDSEEDLMAMVGVSFEGAVSEEDELEGDELGGFELEEEQPPQRETEQEPRRPSLLMGDDWMFDISRRPGAAPESSGSVGQQQAEVDEEEEEGPAPPAAPASRRVSFQNVLLPAVVPPSRPGLELGWGRGQAGEGAPATEDPSAAWAAVGYGESAQEELASSLRPLPVLPEQPGAESRPTAREPVATRVLGMGWGFASQQGGHDDWLFDISKPSAAGAAPLVRDRAAGRSGAAAAAEPAAAVAGIPAHPRSCHPYLALQQLELSTAHGARSAAAIAASGEQGAGGSGTARGTPASGEQGSSERPSRTL